MLEKKLLTLGGAIGILALGACFLPPPRPRKPPAPALPPYLQNIQTIAIQIDDQSALNPFDATQLSHAVADQMTTLWKETPLVFLASQSNPQPDATLLIVVRKKTAVPADSSASQGPWRFTLLTTSTLTARDGRPLWLDAQGKSGFIHRFAQQPPSNPWSGFPTLRETAYSLAISIGGQLLFANTGNSKNSQSPGTPQ